MWVDRGFAVAGELGLAPSVNLLQARGSVRGYAGDARAVDDLRAALELGVRLGLASDASIASNNLAESLVWFRGVRPARERFDEGIEFARGRGVMDSAMWHRGERLRCLYHAGEWEHGTGEADELIRWEAESGGGQIELFARAFLADVLVHRGALAEAASQVDVLLPRARENGDPQVLVPGLVVAALLAFSRGDMTGALELASEVDRMTRVGSPAWRTWYLMWPIRIAAAAGDVDLVASSLDGPEHGSAWYACARLGARAMIAEAKGEIGDAARLYADAAQAWHEWGSVVEQAYALLGLGRCGNANALRDGQAIFERLGARRSRRFSPRRGEACLALAAGVRARRRGAFLGLRQLGGRERGAVEDVALGDLDLVEAEGTHASRGARRGRRRSPAPGRARSREPAAAPRASCRRAARARGRPSARGIAWPWVCSGSSSASPRSSAASVVTVPGDADRGPPPRSGGSERADELGGRGRAPRRVGGSDARKRSVTRTQPTSTLVAAGGPPFRASTSSVEPPPMSTSRTSLERRPRPAATPRSIIAASSAAVEEPRS